MPGRDHHDPQLPAGTDVADHEVLAQLPFQAHEPMADPYRRKAGDTRLLGLAEAGPDRLVGELVAKVAPRSLV